MNIGTVEELRSLYPAPRDRALKKELHALDTHCLRFIQLAPFVVVASASVDQAMDASPRGGMPGFVKALDERTLLVPDAPGNNRLDTLENIIECLRAMQPTCRQNATELFRRANGPRQPVAHRSHPP